MITEILINDSKTWNDMVRSFNNYEVFYLNEYVTAFMREHNKNGIPILLYYCNRKDRAINVVFKRDVGKDENFRGKLLENTYFDLISPYGYGGFFGQIEDYDCLNREYNAYCIQNHYICEFVRFDLFHEYKNYYDGEVETRAHNVIRNLEVPLEEIWMDFKQKVRKNVNRANKYGLQILLDNSGKYLEDFLNIYYSTMERNGAENEYYFKKEFFETLNKMKENIMYFHVLLEGKIISTELVIYGAENAYSYLGGTYQEFFDFRPNDFLKYEIIKWAKERGLKNFVLGGGYGTDDGIFQYKLCFAPKGIVDFYIGRKIFDNITYEELIELRAIECPECRNTKYFPKYRE